MSKMSENKAKDTSKPINGNDEDQRPMTPII